MEPVSSILASRTTTALLTALEDPRNDGAWSELLARCTPMMWRAAVRLGVPELEADDVVQSALARFLESWRAGQYDRARGRLSTYLLTILRSRAIDFLRGRPRTLPEPLGTGEDDLIGPDLSQLDRVWVEERQRQILAAALVQLRHEGVEARSIDAFELYAVRGCDADAVAAQLSMTREDVYNAKYRITRRLQAIVARLDQLYEDL